MKTCPLGNSCQLKLFPEDRVPGETPEVRRERLSFDHMMLLNYAKLRDLAQANGIPWTRPATRAEAVEKWIADVKALGVRAVQETNKAGTIRRYFKSLR